MSRLFTAIILIALVAAGYVWLTPYRTVQHLAVALEHEDRDAVQRYVDFDAVRAGFKDDFVTRMGLARETEESDFASTLVTRIAGAFLASITSPDTMISILKDQSHRDRLGISDNLNTVIGRGSWIDRDHFVLHDAFEKPTMLLTRHGIDWQVTAISLK